MKITTLFLDIGGVFLTNGWDRPLREKAAQQFQLDYNVMNERHRLMFDAYETGKFSLDEYLNKVIFYEPRNFTKEDFKDFMFSSAKAYPEIFDYFLNLKKKFNLKVGFVSNEGRELAEDRVKRFKLKELGDFFVISSFVNMRKPDKGIYYTALDMSQAQPQEILYIDDRQLFIEIAKGLGILGIHHQNFQSTQEEIDKLFLVHERTARK